MAKKKGAFIMKLTEEDLRNSDSEISYMEDFEDGTSAPDDTVKSKGNTKKKSPGKEDEKLWNCRFAFDKKTLVKVNVLSLVFDKTYKEIIEDAIDFFAKENNQTIKKFIEDNYS